MTLIRPDQPHLSAATLTRGLSGPKLDSLAHDVATEVVIYTGSTQESGALSPRQLAPIQTDAVKLRLALARLMPQQVAHQSMMVAGALLAGPHGVVLPDLAHQLHEVANNPQKTAALAKQIEQIQTPQSGESGRGVALLQSLGSRTTAALVAQHVPGASMPAGMFLAGALARHIDGATLQD